jgi:hypothetical protein
MNFMVLTQDFLSLIGLIPRSDGLSLIARVSQAVCEGPRRKVGFQGWEWELVLEPALGEGCLTNPRRRVSVTRQWMRQQRDLREMIPHS